MRVPFNDAAARLVEAQEQTRHSSRDVVEDHLLEGVPRLLKPLCQRLDDRMSFASVPVRLGVDASVLVRLNVDASVPVRLGVDASVDLALQFVEHCEAVSVRGVADLVGEPSEAVDRHQVAALIGAENAQRHGEVLRGGACGDDIRRELEPIGFEHVERASLHGAPASAILPDRRGSR